jgi:Ni/Fe-hydrogenase subunit HybB-like protein
MTPNDHNSPIAKYPSVLIASGLLVAVGLIAFLIQAVGSHPENAWRVYLINFLLWSAMAQGGLLFSAVMNLTKARWSGVMAGVAESFAAFFPISFVLFVLLFIGKGHIFPWLNQDLHGKEVWLNIPFLFSRDAVALLVLYGVGLGYLYYALGLKLGTKLPTDSIRGWFYRIWYRDAVDIQNRRDKMTVWGVLYILAFVLTLSLIGYDLIMSMDPHWYSTLFGAYNFIKAFYIGLGGIIILAALLKLSSPTPIGFEERHFHDIGKLFFGFCLMWGDFFYCQFVVIWYGNIPEETAYIIERIMLPPYQALAWGVFAICFIGPFIILLNKKIKTMPKAMIGICTVIIIGLWLEHLLLIGPTLSHGTVLPLGFMDAVITLGFFGLMMVSVSSFLHQFPELVLYEGSLPAAKESL